ncbi:DUF3472 domain-containing protein [Streptomyces formicae]|uniref:DUF3472 domain-containing protein n=1 Tax=Streptomyces formicae TaxID=1616117 RepID=UPI001F5AFEF6|nr:DUF3472 domain-containing protein [Streptomyces formicae]
MTPVQRPGSVRFVVRESPVEAAAAVRRTREFHCLDFGGEGVGKSCRMRHDWAQGHTYAFRVAHEGDRWFGVTVTDGTTGASFKLWSIRAGSTQIATGGMVDWPSTSSTATPG